MSTRTFSTTSSLDPDPTSPTGLAPVINIINENVTGYILKARLEARLRSLFGYDIEVRHIYGRFQFEAPRKVNEDEIDDLREPERVNW
ncbi:hypothetical protein BJX96DRAFT_177988 [Aspergillus floccosus]